MNRLFWGLLFCILDYELTVGSAVFELLPDFVGYFFLMKGMEELAEESLRFERGRHGAFGMLIVSVILCAANLMNPDGMAGFWLWAGELAALAAQLTLIRVIIAGLAEMEKTRALVLRSELLKSMWLILTVIGLLSHLISWLPIVGDACAIAAIVPGVLFLAVFWKSRKGWYM